MEKLEAYFFAGVITFGSVGGILYLIEKIRDIFSGL